MREILNVDVTAMVDGFYEIVESIEICIDKIS